MTWTSSLHALSLVCVLTTAAAAQIGQYNPYATQVDEPPVTADGKLNWPTLYRSTKLEARYENLWSLGACRGSNKNIQVPVEKNRLDVNSMPEGESSGEVVIVDKGSLTITSGKRDKIAVMVHPAGVSRVSVVGPMSAGDLRAGMIVRLVATVDEHGHVAEPAKHIDVISLPEKHSWQAVEADHKMTITAQVVNLRGRKLTLMVPAGKVRRLSLSLADNATAHVDCNDLRLTAPGDQVTASGHFYQGLINGCPSAVFAADVKVTKRAPAESASSTANATASNP